MSNQTTSDHPSVGRQDVPISVLHVLAQRPSLTGSGITLDSLVAQGEEVGLSQRVACASPGDQPQPTVASLSRDRIHPLLFASAPGANDGAVPFPVVGMSDVMPYPSTRWSDLNPVNLKTYRNAWRKHIDETLARERPDVIHVHHAWVLAALIREMVPDVPLVIHTHGTELRQRQICPELSEDITNSCQQADAWVVLHQKHAEAYRDAYIIPEERIHLVGAGFRNDVFTVTDSNRDPLAVVYAGKLSEAKGLLPLLSSVESLAKRRQGLRLHIAGDGAGPEAVHIKEQMQALSPLVTWHGRLDQQELAKLLRQCSVFVLPSYYEGLPLVLVEALASGCRLVASDLPGIRNALAPFLKDALELVSPPSFLSIDQPDPTTLAAYSGRLEEALDRALERGPTTGEGIALESFTWKAVFGRVENVWNRVRKDH